MSFVLEACSKALWLDAGRVAGFGDPHEVVAAYHEHMSTAEGAVRSVQ